MTAVPGMRDNENAERIIVWLRTHLNLSSPTSSERTPCFASKTLFLASIIKSLKRSTCCVAIYRTKSLVHVLAYTQAIGNKAVRIADCKS